MKTPLYDKHVALRARLVDFAGWRMPVYYGSQIQEHHAVRTAAGVFDVSHMRIAELRGRGSWALLRRLLANDIAKLGASGAALYSCMLREDGGILDDLIVYRLTEEHFRIVSNAGTRAKVASWIDQHGHGYEIEHRERGDLALLAVQGPGAADQLGVAWPEGRAALASLAPFTSTVVDDCFVARTGYTGEDGFEIAMPASRGPDFWDRLLANGIRPCGLGARDTLRLEAGLNLYGSDMDESTTPFECGLAWTVALQDNRDFIGRPALERQRRDGISRVRVGVVLEGPGVMRGGMPLLTSRGEGIITSGSYSPTLGRSIGLARVPTGASGVAELMLRSQPRRARIVKPPFVRNGQSNLPD